MSNFKKELKKLLKKYNASISFDCSECCGIKIIQTKIIAEVNGKDIILNEGYSVDATDL